MTHKRKELHGHVTVKTKNNYPLAEEGMRNKTLTMGSLLAMLPHYFTEPSEVDHKVTRDDVLPHSRGNVGYVGRTILAGNPTFTM